MLPAPRRELVQLARRRQAHVAGDVQLHAGRERRRAATRALVAAAARRRLRWPRGLGFSSPPDLVERAPGFLERLDLQQPIEVFGP